MAELADSTAIASPSAFRPLQRPYAMEGLCDHYVKAQTRVGRHETRLAMAVDPTDAKS